MFRLRIKEVRKNKKLTQKDLADATNLSQCYISKLEKDSFYRTKSPTLQTLETIAHSLNCCPVEIFELSCKTCKKPDIEKLYCCQKTMQELIKRFNENLKSVNDFIYIFENGKEQEKEN